MRNYIKRINDLKTEEDLKNIIHEITGDLFLGAGTLYIYLIEKIENKILEINEDNDRERV